MHITELTNELIEELREYVEVNSEGHIITKKIRISPLQTSQGVRGRAIVGKRRGGKTKYGHTFNFNFPDIGESIACKAREVVWVLNNGVYDPKYKVSYKNGDVFDDRIGNLYLEEKKNGRPVGSKDKKKRQGRDVLSVKQEKRVVELRKGGLTLSQIAEKIETTTDVIKYALKRAIGAKEVKPFFNAGTIKEPISKGGCQIGVYALLASSLDSKNLISKVYIGSSRSTWARIQAHFSSLEKNKHYNTEMQAAYSSGNYKFNAFWLERGNFEHGLELELETEHINKYEKASLFNKWSQPSFEEVQPYLDKYKHYLDDESRYTVDENGCWNWNKLHPAGYGKDIQCSINGKKKFIKPHRLSYYKTYGEYPELIRHMCDNKACVNPKCLKKGSHQQNGLDKSREFRKEFEYWWFHYGGDGIKLTEHFGWKANCELAGNRALSTAVYEWERKLGLRDKYKHLYARRLDSKRST